MALAVRRPRHITTAQLVEEGPEASLGRPLTEAIVFRGVVTATSAGVAYGLARVTGRAARGEHPSRSSRSWVRSSGRRWCWAAATRSLPRSAWARPSCWPRSCRPRESASSSGAPRWDRSPGASACRAQPAQRSSPVWRPSWSVRSRGASRPRDVLGLGLLVAAGLALAVGANLYSAHLHELALELRVSAFAIALLIAGAEVEELATAVVASVRDRPEIAAGDAIGANFTMVTLVLGILVLLQVVPITAPAPCLRRGCVHGQRRRGADAQHWRCVPCRRCVAGVVLRRVLRVRRPPRALASEPSSGRRAGARAPVTWPMSISSVAPGSHSRAWGW